MFTTVTPRFTRRLLPLALFVTFVGGMSGMALVAFFAPSRGAFCQQFALDCGGVRSGGSNRTVAGVAVIEQGTAHGLQMVEDRVR